MPAFLYMVIRRSLILFTAAVWFINGLWCKVLGQVPRHEAIVGEILGTSHSDWLVKVIGGGEILMAVWVLSRWRARLAGGLQIAGVGVMNVLEFMLVPHLLLWGRWNIVFAVGFMTLVYYTEFIAANRSLQSHRS